MKLSELEMKPSKILICGESGSGKTFLAGTMARVLPTLFITSDISGLDTLRAMKVDPDVVLLREWTDVWTAYLDIKKNIGRYKAVAVDDLSKIQETGAAKILRQPLKGEQGATIAQLEKEIMYGERYIGSDAKHDRYGSQWQQLYTLLSAFVDSVLKLPVDYIMVTAIEDEATNPRTGEPSLYPDLAGGMRKSLAARFSLVCSSFVATVDGKTRFALTCLPHPRMETKSRFGKARTWVDPSFSRLVDHILNVESPESPEEVALGYGLKEKKGE